MKSPNPPIAVARGWTKHVCWAVLHVVSLARYALISARGKAIGGSCSRTRLAAENEWLRQELALLREELRIKDSRMKRIPAKRRTPDEIYHGLSPANRRPRFEPRANWPRGSPCAAPCAPSGGEPGAKLELQVQFLAGRRHLPVVTLKRAA